MAQHRYKLKFPTGMTPDDNFVQWADDLFSELGLAPEVAQTIADRWGRYVTGRLAAEETEHLARVDALKAEWGSGYQANLDAGIAAAKRLGITAGEMDALEHAAGFIPAMSLFARLGRGIQTDATGKSTLTILSPEQARAELTRLQGDKAFQETLRDTKNVAARQEALSRWEHLHALAAEQSDANPAPSTTPAPAPAPAPKPAASTTPGKRDQARERISQLTADSAFQSRMRDHSNPTGRDAAVKEWMDLHETAYAPEPAPAGQ